MKENIKILKNNTKLLAKLVKQDFSLVVKVEIIQQLNENLKQLKQTINQKEYEKDFGKLEENVRVTIEKLTEQNFVDKLIAKLKELLDTTF